ncbi:MAG: hypothetical protein OXC11_16550 [Rhodospirillales bacterium]|nr:hypothetical protein [Rhodospirillales bacterium]
MSAPEHRLPAKLHELLDIAIADIDALDRDLYVPDYGNWLNWSPKEEICYVCLAGGVMIGRLEFPRDIDVWSPHDYMEEEHACKLDAIDSLRTGAIETAVESIHGERWRAEKPEIVARVETLHRDHQDIFPGTIDFQNDTRERRSSNFESWESWDTHSRPYYQRMRDALREADL